MRRLAFLLLLLLLLSWVCVSRGQETIDDLEVLPKNCFAFVDESQWDLVLNFNQTAASLSLTVGGASSSVRTCLRRRQEAVYQVEVVGDLTSNKYLAPTDHKWQGRAIHLLTAPPTFNYLIYPGRYRLKLTYCGPESCKDPAIQETVFSEFVNIQSSVRPGCEVGRPRDEEISNQTSRLVQRPPEIEDMTASFHFSFPPCSLHSYDTANLSLSSADSRDDCGNQIIFQETVPLVSGPDGMAIIHYQSPELRGDRYYCVSISLSHVSCRLAALRREEYCYLRASDPVWVPSVPFIATLIPFCTSHFACAWLYVAVGGSVFLLFSLLVAVILVRCCSCRRKEVDEVLKPTDEVDFAIGELTEIPKERISWGSLHKEWESREEKARGKILMLYSPDTKLFKELQEALKSFLDLACHCDIYDLFDDELFDTIALDPSEWLQEFVNDQDVKIVVISSIGAYHRQLALKGSMPLNLPDGLSDNILDGLFTSGLRFISSYPGLTTSGRVATARYEMLHLTEEGYKLAPPLASPAVREFLIPTQLHELFCWVHQLQPLDVMGKPWGNYHLELQLLQDALKLARRDRGVMSSYTNVGKGGGTML